MFVVRLMPKDTANASPQPAIRDVLWLVVADLDSRWALQDGSCCADLDLLKQEARGTRLFQYFIHLAFV
ncbi:hypothetical protein VNO78_16330 [Psophocarpus tetragonolobus]|uniref:Uncharacterized protein n=1 Tax=Psophocarpus tetragonolobus TaxID=3891 RepID=A0AAN9SG30_PSOTE